MLCNFLWWLFPIIFFSSVTDETLTPDCKRNAGTVFWCCNVSVNTPTRLQRNLSSTGRWGFEWFASFYTRGHLSSLPTHIRMRQARRLNEAKPDVRVDILKCRAVRTFCSCSLCYFFTPSRVFMFVWTATKVCLTSQKQFSVHFISLNLYLIEKRSKYIPCILIIHLYVDITHFCAWGSPPPPSHHHHPGK